jgi:hypothetical protein
VRESLAIVDEMYFEGLAMKRAQIQRENPEMEVDAVEESLQQWIVTRPMDAPGRVILL